MWEERNVALHDSLVKWLLLPNWNCYSLHCNMGQLACTVVTCYRASATVSQLVHAVPQKQSPPAVREWGEGRSADEGGECGQEAMAAHSLELFSSALQKGY